MSLDSFPRSFRGRLRWVVRESLLVAGIFLCWIGIALLLLAVLGITAVPIRALRLEPLRFVYAFASRSEFVWAAVTQLALATTALYVLVRAGTLLIDRYRVSTDG